MKSITLNFGTNPQPTMQQVRLEVIKFLQLNGIDTPLEAYISTGCNYVYVNVSYANSHFTTALALLQLIFSSAAGNICDRAGFIEYRTGHCFQLRVRDAQGVIDHLQAVGKIEININK